MANNHIVSVEVLVDVDRASPRYAAEAVKLLDPTKRGFNTIVPDANEIDDTISKTIALALVRQQLNRSFSPDNGYGQTSLRLQSPKNVSEIKKHEHEALTSTSPLLFEKEEE